MDDVLGRYNADAIRRLFDEGGVLQTLEQKGFRGLEVVVESVGRALPHALLYGWKGPERHLLLDACVGEAVVQATVFLRHAYSMERPIELAAVHWVREEDPTVVFRADRPPLPLQRHPGLGVLRLAFRVVTRMAAELGKDGVASVPKFFHDAAIFFRSRLFLFLDGEEQGRFEALARDLRQLSLRQASLALVSGAVRDEEAAAVYWTPGYQVFPLSALLTAYFHSSQYAARVNAGLNASRYRVDDALLSRLEGGQAEAPPPTTDGGTTSP
jgi:hypothetical protein